LPRLNRRDFLKLAVSLPAAAGISKLVPSTFRSGGVQPTNQSNIILIVLDTMSAKNLSIYGYPRATTPNFEKFAERANVYHAHHAGGNFTVPGTASILTGLYPWTHRAINHSGLIARKFADRNIFRLAGDGFNRFAFSQNLWAVHLLSQFAGDIERILSPAAFSMTHQVIGDKFPKDLQAAYLSLDEFLFWEDNPPPSLIFGIPERAWLGYKSLHVEDDNFDYPGGIPSTTLLPIYFRLDEIFDGLYSSIGSMTSPYLAYFHLWGVHLPYRPHKRFYNAFQDWQPQEKPRHPIGGRISFPEQLKRLKRYDEYIASVDYEFGRLIERLEKDGSLEDSYVILTADHGESFERGIQGHTTPTLFEPLIHIPLLVSSPGQRSRLDIHTPTSSVDLLPTLAHITHQAIPEWCEGEPLPGLGGRESNTRSVFSVEAKSTTAQGSMLKASTALLQDHFKLVHYLGEDYNFFELYDLAADPEELDNLYGSHPDIAKSLEVELLNRFELANRPFLGK